MVQSPSWEANWFATSQEIPRISRNPKVLYRIHKRPPPVSILGQPMLRDVSPRNTPSPLFPGDPSGGVVYLRILLPPEESSRKWVFLNINFYREELLEPRPTTKLKDHPSSAVRYCFFNSFAATILIGGRSSTSAKIYNIILSWRRTKEFLV